MYCLDTNVIIAVTTMRGPLVVTRIEAEIALKTRIFVPTIVLFELRYGAAKGTRKDLNERRIDDFLASPIEVVPFTAQDAEEAGKIRAELESRGTPIGHYDVLIAGQARRLKAVLVTNNRREFERVPGLMVQDWSS